MVGFVYHDDRREALLMATDEVLAKVEQKIALSLGRCVQTKVSHNKLQKFQRR